VKNKHQKVQNKPVDYNQQADHLSTLWSDEITDDTTPKPKPQPLKHHLKDMEDSLIDWSSL
jgi:hypothetical protein